MCLSQRILVTCLTTVPTVMFLPKIKIEWTYLSDRQSDITFLSWDNCETLPSLTPNEIYMGEFMKQSYFSARVNAMWILHKTFSAIVTSSTQHEYKLGPLTIVLGYEATGNFMVPNEEKFEKKEASPSNKISPHSKKCKERGRMVEQLVEGMVGGIGGGMKYDWKINSYIKRLKYLNLVICCSSRHLSLSLISSKISFSSIVTVPMPSGL